MAPMADHPPSCMADAMGDRRDAPMGMLPASGKENNTPPADLLPKDLSFFQHHVGPVSYHGLQCPTAAAHRVYADREGGDDLQPNEALTIVHCAHGFGASSLSFAFLIQAAHERRPARTGAPTAWVAHDALGFGFTTATCDVEAAGDRLLLAENSVPALSLCDTLGDRSAAVFLGHSMGAVSAICSAYRGLEQGRRVKGVVLVAPAMSLETIDQATANNFLVAAAPGFLALKALTKVWPMLPGGARRRLLAHALELGVSAEVFWYLGLRFAMGWNQEVYPDTLEQYRCPMARTGWAPWLTAFIEANLIPTTAAPAPTTPTLRHMLTRLVEARVPILLLHDPSDTFIPVRNSEALAEAFPGGITFEALPFCAGHVPHEVDPEGVLARMRHHRLVD